MKKILIASFVGAIILFAWNAISWMVMPSHLHTFQYTPAQDSILNALKNSGLSTGAYMVPSVDNRNVTTFDSEYRKKCEEMHKSTVGKPAATVFYVSSVHEMEAMQFIKG